MEIKIASIDDRPVTDNYSHNLTFARVYLYHKDLSKWFVSIDQDEDTGGTPAEWWFNTAGIRERLEFTPSEESAIKFLSSELAQKLLSQVTESWSIEWDGSNHVGGYDEEAWNEFISLLHKECSETEWSHNTPAEYYEMCFPYNAIKEKTLSLKSFDKAIQEVVNFQESVHKDHKYIVEGDLYKFFEETMWKNDEGFVLEHIDFVDSDLLGEKIIEYAKHYTDYDGDDLVEAKSFIAES